MNEATKKKVIIVSAGIIFTFNSLLPSDDAEVNNHPVEGRRAIEDTKGPVLMDITDTTGSAIVKPWNYFNPW